MLTEIREHEQFHRESFELAAVGIARVGLDGRFLDANDALCAMLRYSRDELRRLNAIDLTPPDQQAATHAGMEALLAGAVSVRAVEKQYLRKDGRPIDVSVISRLAPSTRAHPGYFLTIVVDIERRKTIERELQESEAQFHTLAESLPQIIFTTDAIGTCTYVNSAWLTYSGMTFAQSLGVGWFRAIDPADHMMLANRWNTASRTGTPFEAEFRLIGASGTSNWFLSRAVAQHDCDGRILKWVGALTDVTGRHESLETLQQSEAKFRSLFDANLFGVVFWSAAGEIIDANDAFLDMLGFDRSELEAAPLQGIKLIGSDADRESGALRAALAPYETWFSHRDGHRVPVMVAVADSPGAAGERFSIVVDLSEREAREQFEQEFLADVAHDLRNPLAATKAQAQVMRRRLNANRLERDGLEEGLATIIANSTRMARRIEELTDVAQLRAGHALELMREPVDLVAMTQNAADVYRQATERTNIRVEAADATLVGLLDANRIERVLDNLLSNAVKYSPLGGPIIVTVTRDTFHGQPGASISVTDQGVGIPDSDLEAVFERFSRGSNVKGRVGGSGIGLAGARTIVEQHGGAITVASTLGQGSAFTVHVPLSAPEPDSASAPEGSAG